MSEGQVGAPAGGVGELGGRSLAPTINEGTTPFKAMVGSLDPQLARNPNLTRHEDFGGMAKEYVHLVSKIGEKGILPPKAGDAVDRDRFLTEMGRPANPGAYNFGEWKPPEGMPWDDNVGASLVKDMWEIGLTQDQVPALVAKYGEMQEGMWNQRMQLGNQANVDTIESLKSELGHAYGERMNLAHRAVSHGFGDDMVEEILNTRLENGVALGDWMPFVKAMMKMSAGLKEDEFIDDPSKQLPGSKTPQEAASELEGLMRDPDFKDAYLDPQNPNHKMALTKVDELYAYKGSVGSETNVHMGPSFEFKVKPTAGDE